MQDWLKESTSKTEKSEKFFELKFEMQQIWTTAKFRFVMEIFEIITGPIFGYVHQIKIESMISKPVISVWWIDLRTENATDFFFNLQGKDFQYFQFLFSRMN